MPEQLNQRRQLLTAKEAAEILGVSVQCLNNWRANRSVALPFVKLGRHVRYDPADLAAFIEANKSGGPAA